MKSVRIIKTKKQAQKLVNELYDKIETYADDKSYTYARYNADKHNVHQLECAIANGVYGDEE